MKKHILQNLFLIAILLFLSNPSQSQSLNYAKTYGGFANDEGRDITPLPDSGFLITGATGSRGDTLSDVYLLKIDAYGDTVWQKSFGGNKEDAGNEITPTPDGNFFIAGQTNSYGAGGSDAYLILIDSSGDTLWTRTYGTPLNDAAYGACLAPDGNYFVTGMADSGAKGSQGFLLKITPQGKILWTKLYGDTGIAYFTQVRATPDGNLLLGGSIQASDFWLVKVDTGGNIVSGVNYNYNLHSFPDYADNQLLYGLRIAPDSGSLLVLTSDSANTTGSILLIRFDKTDTNVLWINNIINSPGCKANSAVYSAADTSWVICGAVYNEAHTSFDAFLLKVSDVDGSTKWMNYYGGNNADEAHSVALCDNGDIIFTGYTQSFGTGEKDVYVVRVDNNGNFATGIPQVPLNNSFTVQPNPFSDNTLIRFNPSLKNSEIVVYDMLGRQVNKITGINSGEVTLQRQRLPQGVYFIKLVSDTQVVETKKVVVVN